MLRSLYSGVSGLKVHQTAMDVIGNNISNVNTVGFKSSSTVFSDILYQTTKGASASDDESQTAGTNARQIGLGASVASVKTAMSTQGGSQTTDSATDLMINGEAFFILKSGNSTYFTRNGSFTIDGSGYLATDAGEYVMGWNVDETTGQIVKQEVQKLQISSPENTYLEPEGTSETYITGNIDQKDTDLEEGKYMQMEFYDNLGNLYTAKFKIKMNDVADDNEYSVEVTDIVGSDGNSIFVKEENGVYSQADPMPTISFAGQNFTVSNVDSLTGEVTLTGTGATLKFDASTGEFDSINGEDTVKFSLKTGKSGDLSSENLFKDIDIDFSSVTMFENNGNSSLISNRGNIDTGLNAGRETGNMSGISIGSDGKIYATYTNNVTKVLAQIAVTSFTNPGGLESEGGSLYSTTVNSGAFDGIGSSITELGCDFTVGALEMSNVDLASEFTKMITTQRGYQANSKIITTSDTLLEELINLKR